MTDQDHQALADILHQVQGKVALSGYHAELMDKLYGDWTFIEAPTKRAHSTNTRPDNAKQDRTEVLWINYTFQEAIARPDRQRVYHRQTT